MKGNGWVVFLATVIGIVCIFKLAPTVYVNSVENKLAVTKNEKEIKKIKEDTLDLFVTSLNYEDAKKKQINLGLDLKGGMNVMLQIVETDLLNNLVGNPKDPTYAEAIKETNEKQKNSDKGYTEDFFTILNAKAKEKNIKFSSSDLFGKRNNKLGITYKTSNQEIQKKVENEVNSQIETAYQVFKTRIDRFGVVQPNIQRVPGTGRIQIELPGVKETDRIKKMLQTSAKLEFWEVFTTQEMAPFVMSINQSNILVGKGLNSKQLLPLINFDINGFSVFGRAKVSDTAKINEILKNPQVREKLPINLKLTKFLWQNKSDKDIIELYAIKGTQDGKPPLEGSITEAAVNVDPINPSKIMVDMQMDQDGAIKWSSMTKKNQKKPIAVVLDDLVYTAPQVNEPIENGRSQISGNFTQQEAEDLVDVLKSGKLPARATIVQAEVVGPSLGSENIQNGLISALAALLVTFLWLYINYGRSGMYANIALITNLFFLFGIMAEFGFVLTLPGIAGMVLTLGMSVDANIITNERIKEELRKGKSVPQAVSDGFKYAFFAIFDGNMTAILTGVILYLFGTGTIKGFAITLIIGVLCSFFTAIYLTRVFIDHRLKSGKSLTFSTPISKNLFKPIHWHWMEKRKIAYFISIVLIIISLVSLATRGLNLGLDYVGGRNYVVRLNQPVQVEDLSAKLTNNFLDESKNPVKVEVKTFGQNNQVKIATKYRISDDDPNVDKEINQLLYTNLKEYLPKNLTYQQFVNGEKGDNYGIKSYVKVGPTIADDIQIKAFWAIGIALILIFIYILVQFRKWQFALGGIAALFHDVIIVLGVFSLFDNILPFSLEIDQGFVAAILTVIGYSINDSVIVFDRIRENLKTHLHMSRLELFNTSLNQVFGRTMNTSVLTFMTVLVMFIFGGEIIRGFMFAILIGIGFGTYSSIYIASSLTFDLLKDSKDKTVK